MKKRIFKFMISILIIMLMGCGGEAETAAEDGVYDISVEKFFFPDFEEIFYADGEPHSVVYLGTQFLGEEPVQLWADRYQETKIYLCGIDGDRELLLAGGVPGELVGGTYNWYLDRDGGFYCININTRREFRRLDGQGSELYRVKGIEALPGQVWSLRQAPDGRMYMGLAHVSGRMSWLTLAEVNPEDGSFTLLETEVDPNGMQNSTLSLGSGTAGPAVCGLMGIQEVDQETGEMADVLQFTNTSYDWGGGKEGGKWSMLPEDFCVNDDGSVSLLEVDNIEGRAKYERLTLEKIERITVTVCAPELSPWIKRQIMRFNQENDTYHIMVEECEVNPQMSEAEYTEALSDYARRVSIQLSTGGGPDVLVGQEVLGDGILDMMEKGTFENLAPYMERTSIREEDYFSIVFGGMRIREEVYSICPELYLSIQEADGSILESEPDIRELTEALLSLQEEAVYIEGVSARELLRLFLEGSETLWGMVDWETGTCDFGEGLFTDLLEVVSRYGDEPRNAHRSLAVKRKYHNLYWTPTPSEREETGMTQVGWMFDDGCHAVVKGEQIVVNANSPCKEGAWEFLCFLLGDEAQKDIDWTFPINRRTLTGWWTDTKLEHLERYSEGWSDLNVITGEWEEFKEYRTEDKGFVEDEKIPNIIHLLEDARYLPLRSQPLLDIICEEAEGYFNGWKSAEEVAAVVENRVNLYLNEHR